MADKLISQKKPFYPICSGLEKFLKSYDRWVETPICYSDLLRFSGSIVVYDKNDNDTLCVSVFFSERNLLVKVYISKSLKDLQDDPEL